MIKCDLKIFYLDYERGKNIFQLLTSSGEYLVEGKKLFKL